ncbi:MAG: twin-arginine translocation signal domain-containing protein, partial [Acidobacteria bacterium]
MEKNRGFSRRDFLAAGAASGAVMLTGGLAPMGRAHAYAASGFPVSEASIFELQAAMAGGQLTSRALVLAYLERIAALNPTLHAVIETNPGAVAIAA